MEIFTFLELAIAPTPTVESEVAAVPQPGQPQESAQTRAPQQISQDVAPDQLSTQHREEARQADNAFCYMGDFASLSWWG
ncbi:MAG: hypothetical protein VKK04_20855 [Synechococcales bacterium]|nr:hypothetical protein [Synechococcales bacterium]